ncbi:MAG: ComF family protein [Rhodospirillales bacterium]|jgi:ComF family protein|nr:ComF family protein [Rhodospirillales bacterium]MDP6773122.1 ComF family protein [Rhodospirillales bacterium]
MTATKASGPGSAAAPPGPVRRLATVVLDALLPPQCLGCGALAGAAGTLCPACWNSVAFLGAPRCDACGLPFEFAVGEDAVCAPCAAAPPDYRRARAAIAYDDASRRLVLAFKHGDRTDAAPAFARWMERAGGQLLSEADVLVPVPLHWTRLFQRRYNQAALLAQSIARLGGVAVAPGLLRRRRRTPSQGRLSLAARRRNVRGAFALAPAARVKGRRVLLIDDVMTSGATASACARVLARSGARSVDVLTLARVPRPGF